MIYNQSNSKITFGSKANTLAQFIPFANGYVVPSFIAFTHKEWVDSPQSILTDIKNKFKESVAVRSSAINEDGAQNSYAGAYDSVLGVKANKEKDITDAIQHVFSSYPLKNHANQVFIQQMVTDIDASGVIFTRCVDDGSPYYVFNYDDESGKTDTVTSGDGIHKTVLVFRKAKPEHFDSERVRKMYLLAVEVESLCGNIPLDIEFALDKKGIMHLLQVRRISTVHNWHPDAEHRVSRAIPYIRSFIEEFSAERKGLFGNYTVLGNMPDWNPAELIGVMPNPLAASLFRYLISSSAWSDARAIMGYRKIPKSELMVLIGGRSYIDVRASFNSFLPEGLSSEIGEKLILAQLDRLANKPSLHDKVEFEVAHTIYDFTFDEIFENRYPGILSKKEKTVFKSLLIKLTNNVLDISKNGSLEKALRKIDELSKLQNPNYLEYSSQSPSVLAAHINNLLEDCLQFGTISFNILARHGFIAETLLRSLIQKDAISEERVAEFKSSFQTIMGEFARDSNLFCKGKIDKEIFFDKYGHLRPGTFDILSPSYKERTGLFNDSSVENTVHLSNKPFVLSDSEAVGINSLLVKSGINTVDANGLLMYAEKAIKGREYGKFIFSKNLSAAIDHIVQWGGLLNLGREDLSFLTIYDILSFGYKSNNSESTSLLMTKIDKSRIEMSLAGVLKLSYLVRGSQDVYVVPIHRSEPNFITDKKIDASVVVLKATSIGYTDLSGKIVCIENADPGFDWIFTKRIAGLVTKYGGANSHMAIRSAELRLPAAIGCGEELFKRLKKTRRISLDCASKTIRAIE